MKVSNLIQLLEDDEDLFSWVSKIQGIKIGLELTDTDLERYSFNDPSLDLKMIEEIVSDFSKYSQIDFIERWQQSTDALKDDLYEYTPIKLIKTYWITFDDSSVIIIDEEQGEKKYERIDITTQEEGDQAKEFESQFYNKKFKLNNKSLNELVLRVRHNIKSKKSLPKKFHPLTKKIDLD